MFTLPRPSLNESSEGFCVEVLGQTRLGYREKSCHLLLESQVVTGRSGVAVYKDKIEKSDPPYDRVPILDSDREQIFLPLTRFRSRCDMNVIDSRVTQTSMFQREASLTLATNRLMT
jgi:hypothetical protein